MVEAAGLRLARFPHARAQVADGHDLPFREASFDSALLFHTLTYAEHPRRVVEECARVLRPGGRLVVLSLDQHEQREITASYGERHNGFSPRSIRGFLSRAGFGITFCDVACRESKKPHFEVVLAIAEKRFPDSTKSSLRPTRA
jgi:ArsR family transcriptional regulator